MVEVSTLLLAIWIATGIYAAMCAGEDAYQIARGYNVSHLWQARQRGAALFGFALLAFLPRLFDAGHWYNYLAPVAAAGSAMCLFGFAFDLWLNSRRKLVWYYSGTDPNTAAADKLVAKLKIAGRWYPLLKMFATALLAAAALLLSSCRSADTSRPSPEQPAAAVPVYADGGAPGGKLPGQLNDTNVGQLDKQTASIRRLTPGQQRRLIRTESKAAARVARAAVPRKLGKGATYAPAATTVAASYKPKAPVVLADSGADVRVATAGKNSQAAAGEGNVLEKVEPAKPTLLEQLRAYAWWIGGAALLAYSLLPLPIVGAGWLLTLVKRRKPTGTPGEWIG